MKNRNKSSGYSIIISLLIIGFLLVLSTGIFNLVLNEMNDNRAMGDYIKAYAGAESAQELALLQIKEHGYAYYDKIDDNINNRSILLANEPLDSTIFKANKDVFISFDINSKTNSYSGELSPLAYDIIPLFYEDQGGIQEVSDIIFSIIFGNDSNLSWNIIGNNSGISGTGSNVTGVEKTYIGSQFEYSEKTMNDFISSSSLNYLVLFNSGNSGLIKYNLGLVNTSEAFTMPRTKIISSAQIGKYKQNLSTDLNNTEFLNILRYSIYSN